MQTLVQIICNKRQTSSLRKMIVQDMKLENFNFVCTEKKRKDRSEGWAKIKGTGDSVGAINIEWEPDTKTLTARVINKSNSDPSGILSNFIPPWQVFAEKSTPWPVFSSTGHTN